MTPRINPARFYPAYRTGGGSIEYGITPLVLGQAYIDVVLTTELTDTVWDTICSVVNTDDPTPLNIWPGVITAKSTTGFTVQLNGAPDSSNYFLHWSIIPGAAAPVVVATTYLFSGPGSGVISVASTAFTVHLISGHTVPAPVTVTPSAGGGGGTFTPTTVSLTTAAPSVTFTYTPASIGTKTISVSNSGGLTNPANLSYNATAAFAPSDIAGLKGWFKADAFALSDGAAVTTWTDSSSAGNNMTGTGTFKTNIVGTKPVVRFIGTANSFNKGSSIGVSQPYTLFAVAKSAVLPCHFIHTGASVALGLTAGGVFFLYAAGTVISGTVDSSAAFHVFSGVFSGGNGTGYIDGVSAIGSASTGTAALGDFAIMTDYATGGFAGDVAEILVYNSALGTTDRQNVENFLLAKYGL